MGGRDFGVGVRVGEAGRATMESSIADSLDSLHDRFPLASPKPLAACPAKGQGLPPLATHHSGDPPRRALRWPRRGGGHSGGVAATPPWRVTGVVRHVGRSLSQRVPYRYSFYKLSCSLFVSKSDIQIVMTASLFLC